MNFRLDELLSIAWACEVELYDDRVLYMEYNQQYHTSLDKPEAKDKGEKKAMKWFGVIFTVLGGLFLAQRFIPLDVFLAYWPVFLIVVGVYFIWRANQ
jgi:hypothetical protein